MTESFVDPRMTNVKPRIRYNTIGGINGPLVFLDNVRNWAGSQRRRKPICDMNGMKC